MDFLDPRKKRSRRLRLYLSYALMTSVVVVGTVILVYVAYGYGINTKTGDVIKNGLLFVDSQPGGAEIFLNGNDTKNTTSARMVLPTGSYDLLLKRDGYRTWQRHLQLNEHSIQRFVYPFLWPTQLTPQTIQAYPSQPALITQSPDRRWLLVENTGSNASIISFDEYDLNNAKLPKQTLNFPASALTNYDPQTSKLTEVEWASDNKHLLVRHDYAGGFEFVLLDRTAPGAAVNLNGYANISPTQVNLFDKGIDSFYVFDQASGSLRLLNFQTKVLTPVLTKVAAYKSFQGNLVLYATTSGEPAGKAAIDIWDRSGSYKLDEVTASDTYLIDAAQFQGHWYYAAGSSTDPAAKIYRDPLDGLKDPSRKAAAVYASFSDNGGQVVSFSNNTRFIDFQAGQSFAVYDLENPAKYSYSFDKPLVAPMKWMDGHRLIGQTQGNTVVIDYDDTNQQLLVPTILPQGAFFDRDYKQMFVLAGSNDSQTVSLQKVSLLAGADAPKQ